MVHVSQQPRRHAETNPGNRDRTLGYRIFSFPSKFAVFLDQQLKRADFLAIQIWLA
jgi:hypothetical protein